MALLSMLIMIGQTIQTKSTESKTEIATHAIFLSNRTTSSSASFSIPSIFFVVIFRIKHICLQFKRIPMENIENFLAEDFVLDVQTVCIVEPISFFDFDDMEYITTKTVSSSQII